MIMVLRKLLLSALLVSLPALAQDTVHVTTVRDPVSKSYRKMVEGMDLFEAKHALAPQAELKFRLLPRKRDTRMEDVRLEVVGDDFQKPLKVAEDGTFELGRDAKAIAEDAQVRPNRKAKTMTWRADIRSPGLPANTRRLGDLRLECQVGMKAELVSNRSAWERFLDSFSNLDDYCERANNNYLFFADRPVFSVALVDGERREVLPAWRLWGGASEEEDVTPMLPWCDCEVLLDRTYTLPLGDRSWPDSTWVEIESMDEPGTVRAAAQGIEPGESTKSDVRSQLGPPKVIDFANGYEVWVYRAFSPETKAMTGERVVLFAPSGLVQKSRAIRLLPAKGTREAARPATPAQDAPPG